MPYEVSRTAREHLGQVRTALGEGVGDALAPLVALQEGVMYTPQTPGPADGDAAQQALARFRDALKRRRSG